MSTTIYKECPYCADFREELRKLNRALLGEDGTGMKSGIVYAITQLQKNNQVKASWINTAKPILSAVVSSLITFAVTYNFVKTIS